MFRLNLEMKPARLLIRERKSRAGILKAKHVKGLYFYSLSGKQHILSGVEISRVCVLSVQVFRNCFGREFSFTDVSEIPS